MIEPEGLSERSRNFWREVAGRRVRSPGRLVLFEEGLRCLDIAEQASVERSGAMTVTTPGSGVVHVHPLLKVERENRQLAFRILDGLGLSFDATVDGRENDEPEASIA